MEKIFLFFRVIGYSLFALLWLFIFIAIIGALCILISCFLEYILQSPSEEYKNLTKLKFNNFYDFYSLSPNTWVIEKDYVAKVNGKDKALKFTFIGKEYRKYMKFYNKLMDEAEIEKYEIKQKEKQRYDNQQTIKLLEIVQEEINTIKTKAAQEVCESSELTLKIQDRIKN